jgi:ADP-ribose pyrophosphatase YjhB (NUDIX family)
MRRTSEPGAPGTESPPFRVLFVCTANQCRSPMAEAVARAAVTRRPGPPRGGGPAGAPPPPHDKAAFDHRRILCDGMERARAKLEYTSLAAAFCPSEFTVAELRRVYEIVWGTSLDPRNFHRKVTGSPGFLVPTGRRAPRNGGRPAQLYRRGHASLLNPPITR